VCVCVCRSVCAPVSACLSVSLSVCTLCSSTHRQIVCTVCTHTVHTICVYSVSLCVYVCNRIAEGIVVAIKNSVHSLDKFNKRSVGKRLTVVIVASASPSRRTSVALGGPVVLFPFAAPKAKHASAKTHERSTKCILPTAFSERGRVSRM